MKTQAMVLAGLVAAGFFPGSPIRAQTTAIPATPKGFATRSADAGKGAVQTGTAIRAERAAPEKKIVRLILVGPSRTWTNTEGKKIEASLAAFSAPEEGESGGIELIRDRKVRLLLDDQAMPVEYPLEKLSPDDRFFVKAAAQAVKAAETEADTDADTDPDD